MSKWLNIFQNWNLQEEEWKLSERVKDLSNYATKSNLKNAAGVDTSKFAKKVDLANLKSNVDK